MSDYFTNWVEVLPLPDCTGATCATKILTEVISRYGCPLDIHTDQGSNYESNIFTELCKLLEVRKTRTSPRNPKCNGKVERFNRTLTQMIRAFLKEEQRDWDLYLGCLAAAYRATPHEATKMSPNMLMLAREVRVPIEVTLNQGDGVVEYGPYVHDLRDRMQRAHTLAREFLQNKVAKQKQSFDGKSILNKYHTGDYVWYLSETRKIGEANKLKKPYTGPYVILKRLNELDYLIQMDSRGTRKLVHHDKLKPYKGTEVLKWARRAIAKQSKLKKN